MQEISLFRINRRKYINHDDFYILTSLNEEQIMDILEPILRDDWYNEFESSDDYYVNALKSAYPDDLIQYVKELLYINKKIKLWENIRKN